VFLKKVAGITKLDDGLRKLDKMTNEEARMANAEVLRLAHNINENVRGVGTQVKDVDEKVQGIDKNVQGVGVQVRGVEENVKVVKEMVQAVMAGAQTDVSQSPTLTLIYNRPDGKEAATEAKEIAVNSHRPSSVLSSPVVNYLTQSQGSKCGRTLENGSPLRTLQRITTPHAISNMRERRSGSSTATPLRNGRQPGLSCGSTGSVRFFYP
jgi:hypothetical protein